MSDSYAAVWRTDWPTVYHFAVAMVIARYQDRFGQCRLKQKTIARLARCSPRQVSSVLQDMRGTTPPQIEIVETNRSDGSRGVNIVRLTLAAHVRSDDDPLVTADDFYMEYGADGHAQHAGGGDASRAKGSAQRATKVAHTVRSNKELVLESESLEREDAGVAGAPIKAAFDLWNRKAESLGLPTAKVLTEGRRGHLKARLEDCGGLDGWAAALDALAASRFLCGLVPGRDGKPPFKADLDFILQPSSFARLLEGKYQEGGQPRKISDATRTADDFQTRLRASRETQERMLRNWERDPSQWPPEAGPAPGAPGCVLDADLVERYTTRMRTGHAVPGYVPPPVTDDSGILT